MTIAPPAATLTFHLTTHLRHVVTHAMQEHCNRIIREIVEGECTADEGYEDWLAADTARQIALFGEAREAAPGVNRTHFDETVRIYREYGDLPG